MARMARLGSVALVASLAGLGCKPEFKGRSSEIRGPAVLAVRSTPAEADPIRDVTVHYEALVVQPSGTMEGASIDWAFCTTPKPLAELNDVAYLCFDRNDAAVNGDPDAGSGRAAYVTPIGVGPDVSAVLPRNGCRQFGSDVPEPVNKDDPAGRPADPDGTGGYYQPVTLVLGPDPNNWAVGETRLSCGLPGATSEALGEYRQRYHANQNPEIYEAHLLRGVNGSEDVTLNGVGAGDPAVVRAGETLKLRVVWPTCPSSAVCGDGICSGAEDAKACEADCKDPHGCTGAETYAFYELKSRSVIDRREAMRVSFYATGGSFLDDRTGRGESEGQNFADDTWTAPNAPGPVTLWLVLRDSRGGVNWATYPLVVGTPGK